MTPQPRTSTRYAHVNLHCLQMSTCNTSLTFGLPLEHPTHTQVWNRRPHFLHVNSVKGMRQMRFIGLIPAIPWNEWVEPGWPSGRLATPAKDRVR
ncbi:hypothetical protein DPEC_G00155530 [Dallia pectoralis]|uniref:Uncharacterized protein n=1 Tax=Dallia pectoralis TaxID=75939 RepID=A0ACC2GKR6_DALPE|nr:hypothetical protein DPEC_G00155530 [Dallia pectoralis]